VRISRLKKRRRSKECALQTFASSKQSRHAGVVAVHGVNENWKENILNGLPSISERASMGRDGSSECDVVEKGEGSDSIALQRAGSSLQCGMEGEQYMNGHIKPCHDLKSNKSTLEFMDYMEQSALLSAIPSMLGIDTTRYQSCTDFKQELERAFECNRNHTDSNQSKNYHDVFPQKEIYHSLVGRIDFSGTVDSDEHSIAFPQFRSSCCVEATPKENLNHMILQHLNLSRKTEHGMRIPSSWYQFPSERLRSPSPEMAPAKKCDNDGQPAKIYIEEQPAKNPQLLETYSVYCDDDGQSSKQNEKEASSRASKSPPSSLKCQGKIQITSDNGATIREVCDIDKSNHVIGKLYEGDERYFIEKKILPPPPISLIDESDVESDEECVAVVRYKIVLKPADCGASGQLAGKVSGELVGWISDRGRLADEPYLILREV